jgi:hypothetical protein
VGNILSIKESCFSREQLELVLDVAERFLQVRNGSCGLALIFATLKGQGPDFELAISVGWDSQLLISYIPYL